MDNALNTPDIEPSKPGTAHTKAPNAPATRPNASQTVGAPIQASTTGFGAATPKSVLPGGTDRTLMQERWNEYARTLNSGTRLAKTDWESFMKLTRELMENSQAGDTDYWMEAERVGAFKENRVPRPTKAELELRVNTVTDWIIWQWPEGAMRLEARKRWGVGRDALLKYRQRAAVIISQRAAVHHDEMFAQAQDLIRHLSEVGKKGNSEALDKAITHLRRMGGLDRPVVQEIRVGNPDGTPLGFINAPKRKPLPE